MYDRADMIGAQFASRFYTSVRSNETSPEAVVPTELYLLIPYDDVQAGFFSLSYTSAFHPCLGIGSMSDWNASASSSVPPNSFPPEHRNRFLPSKKKYN